jgi:hypothetical protein
MAVKREVYYFEEAGEGVAGTAHLRPRFVKIT